MPDPSAERAELICVLCGLIVISRYGRKSYSWRCPANAGGEHISPGSPAAEEAKKIHAAWLRDPHAETET